MKQTIRIFGEPELRRKAEPVADMTPEVRSLVSDMLETMRGARGLGLAAEQIGRGEAVCVVDVPAEVEAPEWVESNGTIPMPLVLINPRIAKTAGKQRDQEGCLSFPDVFVQISRAASITVEYRDLDGVERTLTAGGMLARAIQHEVDHLNGVLLVDRMSPAQRVACAGVLRRLRAKGVARQGM